MGKDGNVGTSREGASVSDETTPVVIDLIQGSAPPADSSTVNPDSFGEPVTEGRSEQTVLADEIAGVYADGDFMRKLRRLVERDKEILDRLAE